MRLEDGLARRVARPERAFTLVELVLTITILGILAGIVVFAVGNINTTATTDACAQEKSTISTALETYKAQNGSYPSSITDLTSGSGALLKTTPLDYTIDSSGNIVVLTGTGQNPNNCG